LPSQLNNITEADIEFVVSGDLEDFDLGEYLSTFDFEAVNTGDNTDNASKAVTVNFNKLFCEYRNPGELEISDFDINVEEGFGDDEEFWYPLDKVEVEFDVEPGEYDVEDIEITTCLYDTSEQECVMDEDDMDISDDEFDLDEDDDEVTVTLSFDLDPDDLNEGNNDYKLYVKALGEIDDSNAEELDGNKTCVSNSEEVEIRTDEEFVIFDNIEFPETVNCGDEVNLIFDVWNVGDNEIKDDDIFILIKNEELEIFEVVDVDDISGLDKEEVAVTITIPEDAESGTYGIRLEAYDDDSLSDDEIYENDEEDEAKIDVIFNVECQEEPVKNVGISASLESDESEVKEGKEIVIKATVTNTGEEETDYIIGLEGNEGFSSVKNVNPSSLTLDVGESGEVLITLSLNQDSEGEQVFDITAMFNGQEVSRPVSLTIEPGFGSSISESFQENWFIWVIVLVNIILIVAIIIVAVRMSR
jgi:hypothetical protein